MTARSFLNGKQGKIEDSYNKAFIFQQNVNHWEGGYVGGRLIRQDKFVMIFPYEGNVTKSKKLLWGRQFFEWVHPDKIDVWDNQADDAMRLRHIDQCGHKYEDVTITRDYGSHEWTLTYSQGMFANHPLRTLSLKEVQK